MSLNKVNWPFWDVLNIAYTTSFVRILGVSNVGNESSLIEASKFSWNDLEESHVLSSLMASIFFCSTFVSFLLDWRCCLVWTRCHFAVAGEGWTCFVTSFSDKPWHIFTFILMVLRKVYFNGPKQVARRYSAKSLRVCIFLKITL